MSGLPKDSAQRKAIPVYSGLIKYFPDALAAVAKHSQDSNAQHNGPDAPLRWDRSKSPDELDALMRHIIDEEWVAVAWRALAHLQKQIENEIAAATATDMKKIAMDAAKLMKPLRPREEPPDGI